MMIEGPRQLRRKSGRFALGVAAAIYFAVDAIFWALLWPFRRLIAAIPPLPAVKRWIQRLPPWACLALFVIPLVILEPVKPLGAYWMATGHFKRGVALIIAGEIVKLSLVERLFDLTREQLLRISWFASIYERYQGVRQSIATSRPWQAISDFVERLRASGARAARYFRSHVLR